MEEKSDREQETARETADISNEVRNVGRRGNEMTEDADAFETAQPNQAGAVTGSAVETPEEGMFPAEDPELAEMLRAGVHFGHRKSRVHPKMLPYIFTTRNNVHIIDLARTKEELSRAIAFLKACRGTGKTVLFVGTRPAAKPLIQELAARLGMPYVIHRWVGGTLTNFAVIQKRLEYFRELKAKQEQGGLEKYTKKERHLFDIELRRLEEKFGGIKQMLALPDALFLADLYEDELAAREAKRKGIPVVAITDTNTDPSLVDYPIPGNDDALTSLQYLLGRVEEALTTVTPEVKTSVNGPSMIGS